MTVRQPRCSKEEFARRGDEIYASQVRQQVEAGNHGKIVAIDIDIYLEAGNFDCASRSLKTDIKFSKEVRLPEN